MLLFTKKKDNSVSIRLSLLGFNCPKNASLDYWAQSTHIGTDLTFISLKSDWPSEIPVLSTRTPPCEPRDLAARVESIPQSLAADMVLSAIVVLDSSMNALGLYPQAARPLLFSSSGLFPSPNVLREFCHMSFASRPFLHDATVLVFRNHCLLVVGGEYLRKRASLTAAAATATSTATAASPIVATMPALSTEPLLSPLLLPHVMLPAVSDCFQPASLMVAAAATAILYSSAPAPAPATTPITTPITTTITAPSGTTGLEVAPPRQARTVTLPRGCQSCGAKRSSAARTGPHGPRTLCNACGLRYRRRPHEFSSLLTHSLPVPPLSPTPTAALDLSQEHGPMSAPTSPPPALPHSSPLAAPPKPQPQRTGSCGKRTSLQRTAVALNQSGPVRTSGPVMDAAVVEARSMAHLQQQQQQLMQQRQQQQQQYQQQHDQWKRQQEQQQQHEHRIAVTVPESRTDSGNTGNPMHLSLLPLASGIMFGLPTLPSVQSPLLVSPTTTIASQDVPLQFGQYSHISPALMPTAAAAVQMQRIPLNRASVRIPSTFAESFALPYAMAAAASLPAATTAAFLPLALGGGVPTLPMATATSNRNGHDYVQAALLPQAAATLDLMAGPSEWRASSPPLPSPLPLTPRLPSNAGFPVGTTISFTTRPSPRTAPADGLSESLLSMYSLVEPARFTSSGTGPAARERQRQVDNKEEKEVTISMDMLRVIVEGGSSASGNSGSTSGSGGGSQVSGRRAGE
ncbi:hypothetical protein BC828DRAFT_9087 [Blastocladiella britannica]|nr:hypothetical protein BC828DRAFT_9087 [Blastocladiella britannica]